MSAKFLASCSSDSTDGSSLPAPCSHAHADDVDESGEDEAHEPGPVVNPAEDPCCRGAAQRRTEAGKTGRDAGGERGHGDPVHAARVLVDPVPAVQIVDEYLATPHQEIVGDHDPGDRAEQRAVADEPGE